MVDLKPSWFRIFLTILLFFPSLIFLMLASLFLILSLQFFFTFTGAVLAYFLACIIDSKIRSRIIKVMIAGVLCFLSFVFLKYSIVY